MRLFKRFTSMAVAVSGVLALTVSADTSYHSLSGGALTQDWTNTGLITTNDNWSGVPSITGYLGDTLTASSGVDPRLVTTSTATVDVIANQATPNSNAAGGVAEFDGIANPVVALQPDGTADAPSLTFFLNTTGVGSVTVSYTLRDIDGSADNATQQVVLQYRVGAAGAFVNVDGTYTQDATRGPNTATYQQSFTAVLPSDADNQAQVQVRVITTNAAGNDEWVGIDDISVSGTATPAAGSIQFSLPSYSVDEDGASVSVRITRTGGSTGAVSVDFSTVSDTATAGADFTSTNMTVDFADGVTFVDVVIPILDDALLEANEVFDLALVNPLGGATLGTRSTASVTILEDERATVVLNEIETNPVSTDRPFEYIEIKGPAGAPLGNYYFVQVSGDSTTRGNIVFSKDYSGYAIGTSGLAVIKAETGGHPIPAGTTIIPDRFLEEVPNTGALQSSSASALLFFSTTPLLVGSDLDTNNDGVLDLPAGVTLIDAIGWVDNNDANDDVYGGVDLPLTGSGVTLDAATRFPHSTTAFSAAAWYYGKLDVAGGSSGLAYDGTVSTSVSSANMPAGAVLTPGAQNYPAGNSVPVAVADAYAASTGDPLVVDAASGVLANDSDPDNDLLAAVYVSGPTNGSLTLAADGSFTYTSGPGFFGDATFTYHATDGVGNSTPDTTVTITVTSDAPVVTLPGPAVNYTENDPATIIDSGATVTDSDSPDFNGGTLTVEYTANGTADDRLEIRNEGVGAGQIGVSGSNVTYGGTVIGTFTGGSGTTPLVITFNANSTPAAAQALLRNITFHNVSDDPSTAPRTISVTVTDGDGSSSTPVTKTVNVTAVNDAPVVTLPGGTAEFDQGGDPVIIDGSATVTDPDCSDFDGGTLTVSFSANGTADDRLGIQNDGTGAGQIGVSGGNVTYGGVVIGTFTGGTGLTPLVITFNSSADCAAVQALVRNITFDNVSPNPSTDTRTVSFILTDGDGGTSQEATADVTVNAAAAALPVEIPTASEWSLLALAFALFAAAAMRIKGL